MSETTTETVVETTTPKTFTEADVQAAIVDATKKANDQAAGLRITLKERDETDAATKVKESQDLEELRGIVTKLTEDNKSLTQKAEETAARDKAELEKLLEAIPEALRVHAANMPIADAISYAKAMAGTKPGAPNVGLPGEQKQTTYEEEIAAAKTPADIYAAIEKRGIN